MGQVDDLVCNCFVAGTKVKTASGKKPIEDIEVGDKVWARDLQTGENELRTVTRLFHKSARRLMTVTVADGARLTVTRKHPFYVVGIGWVMSGKLRIGDKLAQRDGHSTAITSIENALGKYNGLHLHGRRQSQLPTTDEMIKDAVTGRTINVK